jgi:hypothetical protein
MQDTLARAYYELAELKEMPALRPGWCASPHNRAIDYLRSYKRRMSEQLDTAVKIIVSTAAGSSMKGAREIWSFTFNKNGRRAMFWCRCENCQSTGNEVRFPNGHSGPAEIVRSLK